MRENTLYVVLRGGNTDDAYLADYRAGRWRIVGLEADWQDKPITEGLYFEVANDVTHFRPFNSKTTFEVYEAF